MHVLVAHGASGGAASMHRHVEGLRARGLEASAVQLPLRRAELAVPAYREQILACPAPAGQRVIGGQSYGGRVASLLVASESSISAGLVCFSYPLHRPGAPDWDARSVHWPSISVPVLFLSGESDPFARLDLLRRAIGERLPSARLVTYPGVGHSLKGVLDDVLDEVVGFVGRLGGSRPGG